MDIKDVCQKMLDIHERKSHDYAQEGNKFSNFERASIISSWFNDPTDRVFATLIGIKLARLAELLNGKEALNEPTEDSFIDCANYVALWLMERSR